MDTWESVQERKNGKVLRDEVTMLVLVRSPQAPSVMPRRSARVGRSRDSGSVTGQVEGS